MINSRIATGDCRELLRGPFDMVLADPPYGDTSLGWDKRVDGWELLAKNSLKSTGSMWVFGSLRFFMATADKFRGAGLKYAQEIVWEKHNGSSFHADRFKRVHELVVRFYCEGAPWAGVFNEVQKTLDADAKKVIRRRRPTHMGQIGRGAYETETGGPRIMRSVIPIRSCHGRAIHPTEKPVDLLQILIRTSCPPGGVVGDFFAGSGACGEAAIFAGREYRGAEIDAEMAQKANDRIVRCVEEYCI